MGVDIHCAGVEYRDKEGKWHKVYMYAPSRYSKGRMEEVEPCYWRDYQLFSILSTSGRGDCDAYVYDRGVPADADYETRETWERDKAWCYGASWMTLAELKCASKDDCYDKEDRERLLPLISNIEFMVEVAVGWVNDCDVRYIYYFDC